MKTQNDKFLTFFLENEIYGIPILKVKEIIGMLSITHIHGMPEYVKGVINLRGKIIPILDLRIKFGFKSLEYDDRTCIIVVEINSDGNSCLSGFIVDTVSEVLDINETDIEPPPVYRNELNFQFLTGIGKSKDNVVMLLNVDEIIYKQDAKKILDISKN